MRLYEITQNDVMHYKLLHNSTLSNDYKIINHEFTIFKNNLKTTVPKSQRDKMLLSSEIGMLINKINKIHHMCVDIVNDDPADKDAYNIISRLHNMLMFLENLQDKIFL